MQQVIDRTLYDTDSDSVEQIAKYAPNTDTSDFQFLIETLYRRDDGEYFLHGRGGAQTTYSQRRNGHHTGGETIEPMSEEDALDWCEQREIDGEVVMAEFADLIDTGGDDS